ncbi:unnamed protein product [Citrullus colocynthis]|uniref:KIB1-4 beta-propeller domain-containing protein n=1 Tax=Citrullus colocynthis TaxID=252529 RepID=A0ABP0YMB7_9ROSI
MANGYDLPIELWALIGECSNTYADYIQFRAVCSSWRNILPKWPIKFTNIPCLMLPYFHPNYQNFRSFYNPFNHEIFYLDLPQSKDQFCPGSSNNGWLITLENDHNLKLLNPLTNSQFPLPPISSFSNIPNYVPAQNESPIIHPMFDNFTLSQILVHVLYLDKIVLSPSPPPSNDFTAVAIHGKFSRLSFTTLGKNEWTEIPTSSSNFHDSVIFNRKVYAINSRAELWASNIENPTKMVNLGLKRLRLGKRSKLYLVKMDNNDDELFMVERWLNIEPLLDQPWVNYFNPDYETTGFNLFKVDFRNNERFKWIKVNNLDDYPTIFLGLNSSISFKCCNGLFNGNRIYYSDDQTNRHIYSHLGGHDFGVFDIASKSCRRLLDDRRLISNFVWPPPIWVTLKD